MAATGSGSTRTTRGRGRFRNTSNAYTPTAAMFSGNFNGIAQQIYNQFSFNPVTGTRSPFAGNQIPTTLINPVSKALLPYYRAGSRINQRPSNYFGQPRNTFNDDQFSVRGDYAVSEKQTIAINMLHENSPVVQGSLFPLAGVSYPLGAWLGTIQDTLTISPRLVNIARIGYSRSTEFSRGEGASGGDLLTNIGIAGTLDNHGITGIGIQGYTGFGTHQGRWGMSITTTRLTMV